MAGNGRGLGWGGNMELARSVGIGLHGEHRDGTLPASLRAMGQTQSLADLVLQEGLNRWIKPFLNST